MYHTHKYITANKNTIYHTYKYNYPKHTVPYYDLNYQKYNTITTNTIYHTHKYNYRKYKYNVPHTQI